MSEENGTFEADATTTDSGNEQWELMNQKIDALSDRIPEPAQEEPETDLYSGLAQWDGDENLEGISDQEVDQILEGGGIDEEGDLDVRAFDELVQERVEEGVAQAMAPYQEAETAKELKEIQDEYPDIIDPENFGPIQEFLTELVQRHQNPNLATDPAMVRMAYQSVKAQRASAGEVSAESAATNEATLETGAGPSQQGDSNPVVDNYLKGLKKAGTGSNSGAF